MKRLRFCREIDNVLAPYKHVLLTCSQGFHVLDRGSVASKMAMEMQVQVQAGDTRQVFFMNPPTSVEELTKAITREIPKTNFMDM